MSKIENELSVFRKFVRACLLSIIPESIEKRSPPEPDILCKLTDGHTLAFELVEIIDSSLMKRLADKIELENDLKRAYDASPIGGLDDAIVTIEFTHDSSGQRRKSAIKPIFKALASLPGSYDGRVPLKEKKLSKTVHNIIVNRDFPDGPLFGVSDVGSFRGAALLERRRFIRKPGILPNLMIAERGLRGRYELSTISYYEEATLYGSLRCSSQTSSD